MTRTRAVLVAIALVAAFGATAGSLPASSSAPSTDSAGDPPTASSGGGSDDAVARPVENPVSSETRARLLAALAAVGVGVAYVFVPTRRRTVALAAGVLVVGAASYAWLRPAAGGVLSAVATAATATAAASGPIGVAVAVLVALGAIALAWRHWRGTGRRAAGRERAADDDPTDASAAAEGPAPVDVHPATRPASNDVVRAWQRAVERVSVPAPAARTPREFLRAAKGEDARGARDPAAFERLTAIFERVRYGDVDPSEAAERAHSLARRAVDEPDADYEDVGPETDAHSASDAEHRTDAGPETDAGGAGE